MPNGQTPQPPEMEYPELPPIKQPADPEQNLFRATLTGETGFHIGENNEKVYTFTAHYTFYEFSLEDEDILDTNLSSRLINLLLYNGITSIAQLFMLFSSNTLQCIRGIGEKALAEVARYFRDNDPNTDPEPEV
jgi:hypothetical protein